MKLAYVLPKSGSGNEKEEAEKCKIRVIDLFMPAGAFLFCRLLFVFTPRNGGMPFNGCV